MGSPGMSADGRYVVFYSSADNLVAGDAKYSSDIFVHDRETTETTRVSVGYDGSQANHHSIWPSISSTGRYISFYSNADNLVSNDTNGSGDIFLHDIETGITRRVSVASNGDEANAGVGPWWWAFVNPVSDDGHRVAFSSEADNLVANDNNAIDDVFVHDLGTGETTRVSVTSDGSEGDGVSLVTSMSGEGRYVSFISSSTNFLPEGSEATGGFYIHDLRTGETKLIRDAWQGTLSGDGRYLAYSSPTTRLKENDTLTISEVFVLDMESGSTLLASRSYTGGESNGNSNSANISSNGKYVSFTSGASNLVRGDYNNHSDAFVVENPHLFEINAGLNDAWHNPEIPGQGFLVTVYPISGKLFLTWVTFDTSLPGDLDDSNLGGPGQRWLTAYGPYSGHTALLEVAVTKGGVFASPDPEPSQSSDGFISVRFTSCTSGRVTYDLPSIKRQGEISIQRVSLENVELCEALQSTD